MSTTSYGTLTTGITLATSGSPEPLTPKGLIVTRAVEVKDGWVGQVIVAEEIVWETDGWESARDAEEAATYRVIGVLRSLFVEPSEKTPEAKAEVED